MNVDEVVQCCAVINQMSFAVTASSTPLQRPRHNHT